MNNDEHDTGLDKYELSPDMAHGHQHVNRNGIPVEQPKRKDRKRALASDPAERLKRLLQSFDDQARARAAKRAAKEANHV
jgi:hypothetical protein